MVLIIPPMHTFTVVHNTEIDLTMNPGLTYV